MRGWSVGTDDNTLEHFVRAPARGVSMKYERGAVAYDAVLGLCLHSPESLIRRSLTEFLFKNINAIFLGDLRL